jgi:fatty acid desaturase
VDEIFVRREVIEPARLRALCLTSNARGAVQLLSHVGAVIIVGLLLWRLRDSFFWIAPLFLLQGVLLNFLYAGQHELSHWTVFRTAWLNEWAGRLIGFVVFYPRTFDQLQHIAHHRYTQDWQRDGELVREPYALRSYLLWMSGITYWYTRWRRILRFSVGLVSEPYIAVARRPELVREARWHSAGYALIIVLSYLFHSWVAMVVWVAPMLAMKFVHQLQNTIEHLGLPHVDNVLINTRSTRTNAVMRWLGWQMQFHTAHHAFPGVPFHRLRELNEIIFTSRGTVPPTMSYLGFQLAVLRAFARGRTEANYPDDSVWISDKVSPGG